MSLAIVSGQLCCVVALVPCTSGTTLYATTHSVGASIGSVVEYSGVCYTVTATTNCGALVTGPFTVKSSCSACGPDTSCATACSSFPSSLTISGLTFANCGGSFPFQSNNCYESCNTSDPLLPQWDYGMNRDCGGTTYYTDDVPSGGGFYTVPLTDGTCMLFQGADITCTEGEGLYLAMNFISCGEGNGGNFNVVYFKADTSTPSGTYSLYSVTGNCSGPSYSITPSATVTLS